MPEIPFTVTSFRNTHTAFIALMVAFIVHNMEEAFAICRFPVLSPLTFIQPLTCRQFIPAVSILSVAGIIAYIIAIRTKKPVVYLFISTALAAVILFNVFIPHVITAIWSLKYTPGLISAVLMNLPVSVLILKKNIPDYTSMKQFYRHVLIGLAVGYLIFIITLRLVLILA